MTFHWVHIGINRTNPAPLTGLNTLRFGHFLGLKPQAVFLRRSAAMTTGIVSFSTDEIFRSSCFSTGWPISRAADESPKTTGFRSRAGPFEQCPEGGQEFRDEGS